MNGVLVVLALIALFTHGLTNEILDTVATKDTEIADNSQLSDNQDNGNEDSTQDDGAAIPIPGFHIGACEQGFCIFTDEGEVIPVEGVKDDIFYPPEGNDFGEIIGEDYPTESIGEESEDLLEGEEQILTSEEDNTDVIAEIEENSYLQNEQEESGNSDEIKGDKDFLPLP